MGLWGKSTSAESRPKFLGGDGAQGAGGAKEDAFATTKGWALRPGTAASPFTPTLPTFNAFEPNFAIPSAAAPIFGNVFAPSFTASSAKPDSFFPTLPTHSNEDPYLIPL